MKKTKMSLCAFALTALLVSPSCKKKDSTPQEPKMPAYTETGANTFACKMNGKIWIGEKPDMSPNFLVSYFPTFQHRLSITADAGVDGGIREAFTFTIDNVFQAGLYPESEQSDGVKASLFHYTNPVLNYHSIPGIQSKVFLNKFDTINRIASGRFQFDIKDDVSSSVIHITEGQFDLKIQK